ncbi:MAG: hypothetical protein IJ567_09370 [Lachnospiraceae bacterium]|nr:hypothetical protein [Lachnospiraceae bacterium]
MMKKTKALIFFTLAAIGLSTAGCGTGEHDSGGYSIEDTEQGEGRMVYELSDFDKNTRWKESWQVSDAAGDEIAVNIDAKVELPGLNNMSVITVRRQEYGEEYYQEVLGRLYGDNDVSRIYHSKANTNAFTGLSSLAWGLDRDQREDADNHFLSDMDVYEGTVDGNLYDTSFVSMDDTVLAVFYELKEIELAAPSQAKGASQIVYEETGYSPLSSNRCEMSVEQAQELADDFLSRTQLGTGEYLGVASVIWCGVEPGEGEDTWISQEAQDDGYVFTYQYQQNGQPFMDDVKTHVYINDFGIFAVLVENPTDITSVTDQVGLLPLDTIQDIMRDELNRNAAYYLTDDNRSWNSDSLELRYERVNDQEDAFVSSYVPKWILKTKPEYENLPVYVNAIDGCVDTYYMEVRE